MKDKRKFFGFTPAELVRLVGVSYADAWRHANNKRRISAEFAVKYNAALGIPLSAMRPDLWPPVSPDGIAKAAN